MLTCALFEVKTDFCRAPQILDATEPFERDVMAPFRMPIIDKYKEMGTIVMGKSESGLVTVGDKLMVMPNKCAWAPCLPRAVRAVRAVIEPLAVGSHHARPKSTT